MTIERAAIVIGFLLLCLAQQQILDHNDLRHRLHRFYATMISKKIFAWWVITLFFAYERYLEVPPRGDWTIEYLCFTAGVFAIDVAQKYAGLKGTQTGYAYSPYGYDQYQGVTEKPKTRPEDLPPAPDEVNT